MLVNPGFNSKGDKHNYSKGQWLRQVEVRLKPNDSNEMSLMVPG